jgi:hypothetical protein
MEIGNPNDIFITDENEGIAAYTFAHKVTQKIASLGIGTYERPRLEADHEGVVLNLRSGDYFDGRLPVVIRKLTLDQLSALYSLFSNWFGYIVTQFMLIAAERSEADRQREFLLNHLKNHYRQPYTGKKVPETAVADAAKTDKRYVLANARYEELNALYNMLEAMRSMASQDMRVISREVTIQQEKVRKELLLQGFGNRGRDYADAVSLADWESSPEELNNDAPNAQNEESKPRVYPRLPPRRR